VPTSGNLLSYNQATFEGTPTGWSQQGDYCTSYQSTARYLQGTHSLAVRTSTSTGHDWIGTGAVSNGPDYVPVVGGGTYTALASLRAATQGRPYQVRVLWYSVKDPATGSISLNRSSWRNDTNSGWRQNYITATAPAGANYARVTVYIGNDSSTLRAGEVHYVDKAGLMTGTQTTWTSP
jgi:hypothetical protein